MAALVSDILKADLHSANFNRVNDTFRWRMLSFQSLFEDDEILIICKVTRSVYLRIYWRFSTILKTNKKVNEVMFFDM